jgi:hypothetical protein
VITLVCWLSLLAEAEPVRVRYAQGSSHGFLTLTTLDGQLIATRESTQTVHGDRVTSRDTRVTPRVLHALLRARRRVCAECRICEHCSEADQRLE